MGETRAHGRFPSPEQPPAPVAHHGAVQSPVRPLLPGFLRGGRTGPQRPAHRAGTVPGVAGFLEPAEGRGPGERPHHRDRRGTLPSGRLPGTSGHLSCPPGILHLCDPHQRKPHRSSRGGKAKETSPDLRAGEHGRNARHSRPHPGDGRIRCDHGGAPPAGRRSCPHVRFLHRAPGQLYGIPGSGGNGTQTQGGQGLGRPVHLSRERDRLRLPRSVGSLARRNAPVLSDHEPGESRC